MLELNSAIHLQFRESHEGHKAHAGLDPTRASTGVVWTSERAYERGYLDDPESWANLGQGAPEVEDDIAGCFDRPKNVDISMDGREYGPTAGIKPLRAAVARLYNEEHRKGKDSQYSWENVGKSVIINNLRSQMLIFATSNCSRRSRWPHPYCSCFGSIIRRIYHP
jgi:hypothetical protein